MRTKSSRFQRLAYARHAAQLAEELNEWAGIYNSRAGRYPDAWDDAERLQIEAERGRVLDELVTTLQRVAIQLAALR